MYYLSFVKFTYIALLSIENKEEILFLTFHLNFNLIYYTIIRVVKKKEGQLSIS